jgi:hypothetical protein
LFFLIDVYHEDFISDKPKNSIKPKMFGLLWTYPVINYVLAAYVLAGRWVFDLFVLNRPAYNLRNLRRQMGCFVLAVMVFVMILYLVYLLSLPDDFKQGLN